MSALTRHMQKYPRCRSTTLSYLIEREKVLDQLRREVAAQKRRNIIKRLWPSWAWRR